VDNVADTPKEDRYWFAEHALFVHYLISRYNHNRMDVLVSYSSDEAALPVFSTKQAAWQFMRATDMGSEWHVKESTAGELISLLMGHIADVEIVVLNPPPSRPAPDIVVSTQRVSKDEFISSLMKEPMLMSPN
jgi:hypothetical protein